MSAAETIGARNVSDETSAAMAALGRAVQGDDAGGGGGRSNVKGAPWAVGAGGKEGRAGSRCDQSGAKGIVAPLLRRTATAVDVREDIGLLPVGDVQPASRGV